MSVSDIHIFLHFSVLSLFFGTCRLQWRCNEKTGSLSMASWFLCLTETQSVYWRCTSHAASASMTANMIARSLRERKNGWPIQEGKGYIPVTLPFTYQSCQMAWKLVHFLCLNHPHNSLRRLIRNRRKPLENPRRTKKVLFGKTCLVFSVWRMRRKAKRRTNHRSSLRSPNWRDPLTVWPPTCQTLQLCSREKKCWGKNPWEEDSPNRGCLYQNTVEVEKITLRSPELIVSCLTWEVVCDLF